MPNVNNLTYKKRKIFTITATFFLCVFIFAGIFVNSSIKVTAGDTSNSTPVPGSADDPLVTLSYINGTLRPQIEQSILSKLNGLNISAELPPSTPSTDNSVISPENNPSQTINPSVDNAPESTDPASSTAPPQDISYQVVQLTKGQGIRAKSGSLEIIARPGAVCTVVSSFEAQGIADISDGAELLNGTEIPINHYLIIPRADGRGVLVTSSIAYLMVRGDYEIY